MPRQDFMNQLESGSKDFRKEFDRSHLHAAKLSHYSHQNSESLSLSSHSVRVIVIIYH